MFSQSPSNSTFLRQSTRRAKIYQKLAKMSTPGEVAQERELVLCHGCENEWWKDERGLECPRCHCDIVEIVSDANGQGSVRVTNTVGSRSIRMMIPEKIASILRDAHNLETTMTHFLVILSIIITRGSTTLLIRMKIILITWPSARLLASTSNEHL